MTHQRQLRLGGLEPDNVLAFMALLGLLRALERADPALLPRAAWDLDRPPLRPQLFLERHLTHESVAGLAATGVELIAADHSFDGKRDLNYTPEECRAILEETALAASAAERSRADLLAALMSDAAIKDGNKGEIDPTPLCLLFGQGHQHFLARLASVPCEASPPPQGRGSPPASAAECLGAALFQPWRRQDRTFSFRWDPAEDVRYALMAGDPTDAAYKEGTQHGANRLAAVGLAALTVCPEQRGGRVRPVVIGGAHSAQGFSFAWPIWRDRASLPCIRALLSHPGLREPGGLSHLSVEYTLEARRISVGKFMNFTRARRLEVAIAAGE